MIFHVFHENIASFRDNREENEKSRVTSRSKAKVMSAVSRISKIERSSNIYDHFDVSRTKDIKRQTQHKIKMVINIGGTLYF